MAEAQPSKRERQPISIPFIWEEKPGMPKKDWKPISRPVEPPAPPVKFVVSVPFGWEEKPGTPFPAFIHPPKEDEYSLPPKHSITDNNDESSESEPFVPPRKFIASVPFEWEEKPGTPLPAFIQPSKEDESPPPKHSINEDESSVSEPDLVPPVIKFIASVPFGWEEKPGTPLPTFVQPAPKEESQLVVYSLHKHAAFLSPPSKYSTDDDQRDNEGDEKSSESELETCSVESDDSFISAKSLLANGLISTATISNAVPVQQNSLALVTTTDSTLQQCPGSPASETDSTCSYAAGTTSLAGASFLEWLFPLLVPNSNVSNKVIASHTGDIQTKEYYLNGSNCSQAGRPLLTLGDLIAMSRRRSCQRKVNKMHKQPSMDFLKRNAFGCCFFGTGNEINHYQLSLKWKRQLQLKLM